MRLVKFKFVGTGRPVYINPRHVVAIENRWKLNAGGRYKDGNEKGELEYIEDQSIVSLAVHSPERKPNELAQIHIQGSPDEAAEKLNEGAGAARLVEFIQTYDNEPILVNPDHVLNVERASDRLQNPDGKTYTLAYSPDQCYISYALVNQRPEYDDPIFKSRVFGSLAEVKAKLEGVEER